MWRVGIELIVFESLLLFAVTNRELKRSSLFRSGLSLENAVGNRAKEVRNVEKEESPFVNG